MITVPISKAALGWSPTPFQAPALRPRLAQTVVTTPTTPPGGVVYVAPAPKPDFIDSALINAMFSGLGTAAYGILLVGAYNANWKKSTVIFGALTFALGIKTILDLLDSRTR